MWPHQRGRAGELTEAIPCVWWLWGQLRQKLSPGGVTSCTALRGKVSAASRPQRHVSGKPGQLTSVRPGPRPVISLSPLGGPAAGPQSATRPFPWRLQLPPQLLTHRGCSTSPRLCTHTLTTFHPLPQPPAGGRLTCHPALPGTPSPCSSTPISPLPSQHPWPPHRGHLPGWAARQEGAGRGADLGDTGPFPQSAVACRPQPTPTTQIFGCMVGPSPRPEEPEHPSSVGKMCGPRMGDPYCCQEGFRIYRQAGYKL